MNTIYSNSGMNDEERASSSTTEQLFVYSASPASLALIEFAREMIIEAFGSLGPETA
jgi:hypothetical protein